MMTSAELAPQAAATDEDMFNNFLSAIKEENASLRVDKPNNLGCLDTHSFGADTTAKIADRIASLLQEADDTKRILGDPVAVQLNMLSGRIAKISMENCAHVHGIQFNDLEAAEAALASRLEQNEALAGQLAAAMEEIASLKQSLAEAEGQIRHLEQRLSEVTETLDAVLAEAARREECGDAHSINPESFEDLEPVVRARAFLAKKETSNG